MLDIELEEVLVKKIGGKFALTSLIQKRIVELNRGEPPLVEVEGEEPDLKRIVCREILEEKISLAPTGEIETHVEEESPRIEAEAAASESDEVEIYGSDIKKIKEQRIKELSQLLNPKT